MLINPKNSIKNFQSMGKVLKGITSALVLTLLAQQISPTILAASEGKLTPKEKSSTEILTQAQTNLASLSTSIANYKQDSAHKEKWLDSIEKFQVKVEKQESQMLALFEKEKKWIESKNLSPIILERHNNMKEHYLSQMNILLDESKETLRSERGSIIEKMRAYIPWTNEDKVLHISPFRGFDTKQFERKAKPFDPDNLPTRSLKPNPKNTPKKELSDFTLSGLLNTPQLLSASLDFTYNKLADASKPEYLAQSDEILLTQAIKDKAEELNHDPIEIHQWVRNNIEYLPTWGSAQNSQLTLDALRGNAMDISSLTIALLRASNIPSRYAHGVIEIPADKFMNWVGNFTDINAAVNYAGAGGIPIATVVEAGKVKAVQMEHIWVEAAIDYYPSRGAKNIDADSWIQLDDSFKQYEYTEGVDTLAISGINIEELSQNFINSGTTNEDEGWVQDINTTLIQESLQTAQIKMQEYLENQESNESNLSAIDILGGAQVIIQEYPILPSSLPNQIVLTGTRYDKLPSQLQQSVHVSFYDTQYQGLYGDKESVRYPYAKVNNQKLTLSFKPATEADEDALAAILPEGNITDESQLPSSISANLIQVIPELKLNEVVVATGTSISLGEKVDIAQHSYLPGLGNVAAFTHTTVAGSYLNINLIAQSVSPKTLERLREKMLNNESILSSSDKNRMSNITSELIVGDLMYAATLGYYAQQEGILDSMAKKDKVKENLRAGNGVFGYEPKVIYLFGVPYTLSAGAIHVDISDLSAAEALNGDNDVRKNYALHSGMLGSSLEHMIPEQMFSVLENHKDGISTIKALQLATKEGQKIYEITKSNYDLVLPNLNHRQSVMDDIKKATQSGKTVTIHESEVSIPGWSGSGYIILDELGNGAYLISGGENGGAFTLIGIGMTLSILTIGIATFAPELLLFGPVTDIVGLLFLAATSFIAAGISLLYGDKLGCMLAYSMGVAFLTALIGVTLLISVALEVLGFVDIPLSATEACYCKGDECDYS